MKLAMEVAGVQAVESELDIAFQESDKKLGENVAKEIRRYVFFTIYDDVNIGVEEGIVTLTRSGHLAVQSHPRSPSVSLAFWGFRSCGARFRYCQSVPTTAGCGEFSPSESIATHSLLD